MTGISRSLFFIPGNNGGIAGGDAGGDCADGTTDSADIKGDRIVSGHLGISRGTAVYEDRTLDLGVSGPFDLCRADDPDDAAKVIIPCNGDDRRILANNLRGINDQK